MALFLKKYTLQSDESFDMLVRCINLLGNEIIELEISFIVGKRIIGVMLVVPPHMALLSPAVNNSKSRHSLQ